MKPLAGILLLFLMVGSTCQAQFYYYAPRQRNPQRNRQQQKSFAAKVVPVTLTPAEQAAKSILDRMAEELNRSEGINYTGVITYSQDNDGKPVSIQTTAATTLERPAKMMIEATSADQEPDGSVSANGKLCTVYNGPDNKYINVIISPDLYSLQQALALGAKSVFTSVTQSRRDLRAALEFPMVFFNSVYDSSSAPEGETLAYSSANSTSADGKPAVLVTETLSSTSRGSVAATYMIDSKTNLPLQFTQIESRPGKPPVTDLQETFSNMKIIRNPLPLSTYTPPLPLDAKLVSG
jgi:hypothetical protein